MTLRTLTARLILLGQLIYTGVIYKSLPAIIPNAYDASGTPHRFATRAILWLFLLLNIGIHFLLTVIARYPNAFNLPGDRNNPDRPRQMKLALNLLSWLQIELAALLASQTWELAHESPHHRLQSELPFAVIIAAILMTAFAFLFRIRNAQTS